MFSMEFQANNIFDKIYHLLRLHPILSEEIAAGEGPSIKKSALP